jgi:hypothetical protein
MGSAPADANGDAGWRVRGAPLSDVDVSLTLG